jgi:uncharacterized protein (TIGR02466 family)
MDIHQLFPIPVGVFELGRPLTTSELSFIGQQNTTNNTYNIKGTNSRILDSVELEDIKQFIQHSLEQFINYVYDPINSVTPYVTQSWINVTKTTQSHHKHNHQNSFISGVFYIQTNSDDRIYFHKDSYDQLFIEPKPDTLNVFNHASWWLPARPYSLILFPSGLQHSVDKAIGNNDRISLAFNTFIRGDLGHEINFTQLSV